MTAFATVTSASAARRRDRAAHDYYREPVTAVQALFVAERFVGRGWDPACGRGTIPSVAQQFGLDMIGSDIVDRAGGTYDVRDFLDPGGADAERVDFIVTNPPFSLAEPFIERAMQVVRHKAAFLVRLAFLEGRARRERIFERQPLARVHVFSRRISMPPGDLDIEAKGGAVAFAWIVFEHGWRGPPTLGWLP